MRRLGKILFHNAILVHTGSLPYASPDCKCPLALLAHSRFFLYVDYLEWVILASYALSSCVDAARKCLYVLMACTWWCMWVGLLDVGFALVILLACLSGQWIDSNLLLSCFMLLMWFVFVICLICFVTILWGFSNDLVCHLLAPLDSRVFRRGEGGKQMHVISHPLLHGRRFAKWANSRFQSSCRLVHCPKNTQNLQWHYFQWKQRKCCPTFIILSEIMGTLTCTKQCSRITHFEKSLFWVIVWVSGKGIASG